MVLYSFFEEFFFCFLVDIGNEVIDCCDIEFVGLFFFGVDLLWVVGIEEFVKVFVYMECLFGCIEKVYLFEEVYWLIVFGFVDSWIVNEDFVLFYKRNSRSLNDVKC